ncbi:Peroxisomal carnitine O-octanoyltransferase [Holothuria leucospilota]|uniref:Peroxisomal carnitine O-octanoyltransferase n=1 Tax=Holothuria leucospilota TaxID=206669 RepID=A0A9Q1HL02_HOLLE|nr:Peroxisomal carnitine O-octanoyltransferase [Holothuria leucospilota]
MGRNAKERTFAYEEDLPHLPVPPLKGSLDGYLASVKPVVTKEEYENTEKIVREFETTVGPKLHSELLKRAASCKNWLEEWWERYAYLTSRDPIAVINGATAMDGINMSDWPPRPGTQLKRAAQMMWVASKFFLKLRREEEKVSRDPTGKPISMHQLRSMFCTSREPGKEVDKMIRYFKTESEGSCSNHVVVFCNGHIFKMEVFDKNEELFGSFEIERQLKNIKERSATGRGQSLGVLTAGKRDDWAKIYKYICDLHVVNAKHFETIRSATFAVCLDGDSPKNVTEAMLSTMEGDNVHDRWFDKTCAYVFFENGVCTYTTDHTAYDGMAAFRLAIHNQKEFNNNLTDWMGSKHTQDAGILPEELIFVIDGTVEQAKEAALRTYKQNVGTIDLSGSHIECSRKWVKSKGFSPDAFMQMAIQLAYFTKYGRPATCYETGAAVMFYHGRTDTIRTCSQEMVDWCRAMLDNSKQKEEKIALMRRAHEKHHQLTMQAVTGQAFDRHLMGLYITSQELGMDVPEIFTDVSYSKSGGGGNFILSTSQLGRFYQFGAVAPMVKDGYGVFYNILEERYFANVVANKRSEETDCMEFFDQIRRSMMTMRHLLADESTVAKL